jgi:hypothetical protein
MIRDRVGDRAIRSGRQDQPTAGIPLLTQPCEEFRPIRERLGTKLGPFDDDLLEGRLPGEEGAQGGRPSRRANDKTQTGLMEGIATQKRSVKVHIQYSHHQI